MKQLVSKSEIAERLQKDILSFQGFRSHADGLRKHYGLGEMESAFPNGIFPTGAVHEFLSDDYENAAATAGFMSGLLSKVMPARGCCLWISSKRTLFPPALKFFGIEPDRVIFVDLKKKEDLLWAIEEALRCDALAAVVGEVNDITLTESRRLQFAVEQSRVTGFLHRCNPRSANTLASVSRWKVTPIPSELEEGMPGVGYPRWHVELLKVRNGEPGSWDVEWSSDNFQYVRENVAVAEKKDLVQSA